MTQKTELQDLEDQLSKLEKSYWMDNIPLVPDEVYDNLRRRYRDLTGKERPIGSEGGGRKTLPSPMYSLDNVFNRDEYEKWIRGIRKRLGTQDVEFIVEPKFDGISLSLHCKGDLLEAYTRGDGRTGEPIKDKLPDVLRELKLPVETEVEIRGEVYVKKNDFISINETRGDNPYATERQCAVGVLRGSDTTNKNTLTFTCFGLGIGSDLFVTESDVFSNPILSTVKGSPILYRGINASDAFAACEKICHGEYEELKDIPMDGAVIKVNSISDRAKLGYTAHHPRWAVAVKLRSDEHETTIVGVEWGVGVQGTITPVLLVEPITIGGVLVSRVTGDNVTRFNEAGYSIGDTVWVKRAGDVIPKIVRHRHVKDQEILTSPKTCPACGFKTITKGMYLVCSNGFLCDGQKLARLEHFCSRNAMDLKGFGVAALKWFVGKGIRHGADLIATLRDIHKGIHPLRDEFFNEFGDKISENLMQVCLKKDYPLHRVIFALGIPSVGYVTAGHIARAVGSLVGLLDVFSGRVTPEIPNVYSLAIENTQYWVDHPDLCAQIIKLDDLVKTSVERVVTTDSNKVVCFTGTGDGFDRGMLEQSAKSAGYTPSRSVTKNTTYLVTGKTGSSKNKIDKAIKHKVQVLTVPEWIKLTT